jgi:predicted nucleic acid-binding protein/plasmid stability protein
MTNIQIKGVPERTHAVLRKRAAAAHQSLREYLLQHLIEEADRPTLDEVLDSAGCGTGGSVSLMRSMPSSARTVIVTDAGVLIATFVDDGAWGDTARARLRHEEIAAPELIDLEVTSAFRGLARAGKVDERRAFLAFAELRRLALHRASHHGLVMRCWELRDNLSVSDASHIALAELLGVTLVTTDARMSRASPIMCSVEVLSLS